MKFKMSKKTLVILGVALLAVILIPTFITLVNNISSNLAVTEQERVDNEAFYNSWSSLKSVETASDDKVDLNYTMYDFRSNVVVHIDTYNDEFKPLLSKMCHEYWLSPTATEKTTVWIKPYFVFDKNTSGVLTLKGCFYEYRYNGRDDMLSSRREHTGHKYVTPETDVFKTIVQQEFTYQFVGEINNGKGMSLPLNNCTADYVVTYAGYNDITQYIQSLYSISNGATRSLKLDIPEEYFAVFADRITSSVCISADLYVVVNYKNNKGFRMPADADDIFVEYIKSGVANV